jgi:rhodanese-related sulfurtransferase
MIDAIKKLFGITSVDYEELVKNGAKIIDVRTPGEFQGGHIKKSVNYPLQSLQGKLKKLDKNATYIMVCASGMRSGSAKGIMKRQGFVNVHNGGSWASLRNKIA